MMTTTTSVTRTHDYCGIIYEAIDTSIPDEDEAYNDLIRRLRSHLPNDLFFELDMTCNLRVGAALENGFRAGWNARSEI